MTKNKSAASNVTYTVRIRTFSMLFLRSKSWSCPKLNLTNKPITHCLSSLKEAV